jgi:hypothetical protein
MDNNVAKSLAVLLFVFIGAVFATQCGHKASSIKVKDQNAGSEWVYGADSTQAAK